MRKPVCGAVGSGWGELGADARALSLLLAYRRPVGSVQDVKGQRVHQGKGQGETQGTEAVVGIPRVDHARFVAVPKGHVLWAWCGQGT